MINRARRTSSGIPVLAARVADDSSGAIYAIYMSHETEFNIFPNAGLKGVRKENIQTVLTFLNDVEFIPIEKQ